MPKTYNRTAVMINGEASEAMKRRPEVRWSEIARRAILEYSKKLDLMEHLLKDEKRPARLRRK